MITKQQIIKGISEYVKNEILVKIDDQVTRLTIGGFVVALEVNPDLLDILFSNPLVSSLITKNGDQYELDKAFEVVTKTLDRYGSLPITIPPIKYLSPAEKKLSFSSDDIQKLKAYIES